VSMAQPAHDNLPVLEVLPALVSKLSKSGAAVLVAPPGAGKTTRVPLALLGSEAIGHQKIVLLEPRRIAARAAARRMADLLREDVGETVGLRTRFETKTSRKTRIEVVTEGVFTRMILADPGLEGFGCVLFDEFHERSIDADLGLALALDCKAGLREDLHLIVMSATLAGAPVAKMLGDAPVIESTGRMFPIETRYLGRNPNERIEQQMTDAVARALRRDEGSILAFLPGQGEILRTAERLEEHCADLGVIIAPLFGAMDPRAQDLAIAPAPDGRRKVVLATAIAESSLTIEGVRIVIDSGLARVPRFEPGAAVTRLETIKAPLSSVDQRRGRAGRTSPGICYRLWDEPQTKGLPEFAEPEIRAADLSGLLLDCADWGVADPSSLCWLDPPPAAAIDAARQTLTNLEALDGSGHITAFGRALRRLPLPPRLAGMVISATPFGASVTRQACEIAALLVERGLGGKAPDLAERLERFRSDRSSRARQMRNLAENWTRLAQKAAAHNPDAEPPSPQKPAGSVSLATHLATAYPDRLAKARGRPGQYLLANGRGAHLTPEETLARAPYLVVAELQGAAASTRILSAASASEDDLHVIAGQRIEHVSETDFDPGSKSLRARRITRLGAIVLNSKPVAIDKVDAAGLALTFAEGLAGLGIDQLPWSKPQQQLRARVRFLRTAGQSGFPDLSDRALTATVTNWLAPFIEGKTTAAEITSADLNNALTALIPWQLKQQLDDAAPTHYLAPTGQRHPIDYQGEGAPALHIRVQELFGLKRHPAIAGNRLPLTLYLLSPAGRPIQITKDLPGFWSGSWSAVKAEMKGRYPKHVWPDDPASAQATRRAKPRPPA
jgi:ATP-dependent RNA helicase HrpB